MELDYLIKDGEVTVTRCYGKEARVALPGRIEGCPVTRLEAYIFSDGRKERDRAHAICGEQLLEVCIPSSVREIGNYAFYGCRKLEKLTLYHETSDIAGGAFTGCHRLSHLDVHMEHAWGYCLKDLVSELHHELSVTLYYEDGPEKTARLLFPEYYEEAVENTPARILETHFHGSGYAYRQIFRDGKIVYPEYDRLFFEAQNLECEDFCIELCLLRLMHPRELSEEAWGCYRSWLMEHRMSAASWCIEFEQEERLEYLAGFAEWTGEELGILIAAANQKGRISMQSFLMDYKHQFSRNRKKTFEW